MRAERRAEPRAAIRWRGSSAAAAPPWRSNPSPGPSGRSARALAVVWAALAFGLAEVDDRGRSCWRCWRVAGVGAALRCSCAGCGASAGRAPAAARARVDATLPGRPLAALRDTPALGRDDPGAQAVWAAHLARMRRLAATARPVRGGPAAREPRPLGVPAGGAGGAGRGGWSSRATAASSSVAAALAPAPGTAVAAGPSFEGWAEPPAYTGRPTLYLPEVPGDAPVSVPQGTVVTLRVYGARRALRA